MSRTKIELEMYDGGCKSIIPHLGFDNRKVVNVDLKDVTNTVSSLSKIKNYGDISSLSDMKKDKNLCSDIKSLLFIKYWRFCNLHLHELIDYAFSITDFKNCHDFKPSEPEERLYDYDSYRRNKIKKYLS